jgi:hypothetical protein
MGWATSIGPNISTKWLGFPFFCGENENAQHLFFGCSLAKIAWGAIGRTFGARCYPRNLWQAFVWFHSFLPGGEHFDMIVIAAACWGIWTLRNKVTFEKYTFQNPTEIEFIVCSFLMY